MLNENRLYKISSKTNYGKIRGTDFNWYHYHEKNIWVLYSNSGVVTGTIEEIILNILKEFGVFPKSLANYLYDSNISLPISSEMFVVVDHH